MNHPQRREALVSSLALFTSLGTLVCCALPAMLVTLGAGAVMAGLVTAAPQLVWLSGYKGVVFAVAGAMLIGAVAMRVFGRNTCPTDPGQRAACERLRKFGGVTLSISALVYLAGAYFAFLAPLLAG